MVVSGAKHEFYPLWPVCAAQWTIMASGPKHRLLCKKQSTQSAGDLDLGPTLTRC